MVEFNMHVCNNILQIILAWLLISVSPLSFIYLSAVVATVLPKAQILS